MAAKVELRLPNEQIVDKRHFEDSIRYELCQVVNRYEICAPNSIQITVSNEHTEATKADIVWPIRRNSLGIDYALKQAILNVCFNYSVPIKQKDIVITYLN